MDDNDSSKYIQIYAEGEDKFESKSHEKIAHKYILSL